MDPILSLLLSWQFILFSLFVAGITFIVRKIVEYLMNSFKWAAKESKLWGDLILPILPIILGAFLGARFKHFPFPDGLSSTGAGRLVFGLVAGLLSSVIYRVINSLLGQKIVSAMSTLGNNQAQQSQTIVQINQQTTNDSSGSKSMSAGNVDQ